MIPINKEIIKKNKMIKFLIVIGVFIIFSSDLLEYSYSIIAKLSEINFRSKLKLNSTKKLS